MKIDPAAAARLERELFIRTRLARLAEPGFDPASSSLAEEVTFQPGAILYRAGEPPVDFYSFLRGTIEVLAPGLPPWILKNQTGVGLLEVLADRPRTATVTAVTRVRAMKIRAVDYLDFLEEHYELALASALRSAKDVHDISLTLAPDGGFPQVDVPEGPPSPAPIHPMNLVQKIEVLRDSRALRKANVQALVRLSLLLTEIRRGASEVVFARGEAAGRFYLVAEGVVEVQHQEPQLVARMARGDLLCGYGALGNADNQYVAIARTPAIVFAFSEEDFFDVMEEHFALTRSVLAAIASDYTRLVLERERRMACAEKAQDPR